METNEAPEKIYLFENPVDNTPDYRWLSKRSCNDDIEYIRTDAFIKKACDWLINHNDYICDSTNGIVKYDMKRLVGDFRNYMER